MKPAMNILQLVYLLEISRQGSISKAAEKLYVSQPAVSHQILKLEDELGISLLERSPQGVKLTDAGEQFCLRAEETVKAWNELKQYSNDLRRNKQSTPITIWLGPFIYDHDLIEPITGYFEDHPEVEYSIESSFEAAENLYEELACGRIHIAIDRLPPVNTAKEPWKYKITPVFEETAHVMLAKKHPLRERSVVTADDLRAYVPITFGSDTSVEQIQQEVYHDLGIDVSRQFQFSTVSMALDQIRRGQCYAIGRKRIAETNRLLAIPFSPVYKIPQYFICLSDNASKPVYSSFFKYVKNLCRCLPPE